MKGGTDKMAFVALGIAGVLFLFYFMVLGPKRQKAASLADEITQLESSVQAQKQTVTFAEQARRDFPEYYGRLVTLGKAVPDEADSASMLVQVNTLAEHAGVDFRGIELSEGAGDSSSAGGATAGSTAPAPATGTESTGSTAPPAESAPPATGDTGATPASTDVSTAPAPAPATEATAASLPIGASVGPAGLATLPYDLTFSGTFFGVANFMAGVDSLVTDRQGGSQVAANGRLLTVDGFALSHPTIAGVPKLQVDVSVTSYVLPPDQGMTAGATVGGPAPAPAGTSATPASATTVAP